MKHIIVGTAGHIDHGKTTLIKRLTGIDTDRLKEEKVRGITIELGFAYFDLPSGKRAGIVDVPGHERFIKHMLAGATGMDIVILVIAADEGVMPQTKEHLHILSFLNIKKGIVVITKADTIDDPEWLELLKEEIKDEIKGTFLEEAPIISLSAATGQGIDELINTIDKIAEEVESKDINGPLRIPIDRVFTMTGFGTVITGTLFEGHIKVGQEVEIYPTGLRTRIRNIQVHGQKVEEAYAGQRVALNLAGLKVDDLERGNVIASLDTLKATMILDVRFKMVKDFDRKLRNRERLRLHLGSKELLCRGIILDADDVQNGEECLMQLRLEEPTVARKDDRYVLRTYSPVHLIGGGRVIDSNPKKKKRFRDNVIKELKEKEIGSRGDILEGLIKRESSNLPFKDNIYKMFGGSNEAFEEELEELMENEKVISITINKNEVLLHKDFISLTRDKIIDELKSYHQRNPLKTGIAKEELRTKILKEGNPKAFDSILLIFEGEDLLEIKNHIVLNKGYVPSLSKEQEVLSKEIQSILIMGGFSPPSLKELEEEFKDKSVVEILSFLQGQGDIIRVSDDIIFHKNIIQRGKDILTENFPDRQLFSLAQARDLMGSSRKYILPLLEYFDSIKFTRRTGDNRIVASK